MIFNFLSRCCESNPLCKSTKNSDLINLVGFGPHTRPLAIEGRNLQELRLSVAKECSKTEVGNPVSLITY